MPCWHTLCSRFYQLITADFAFLHYGGKFRGFDQWKNLFVPEEHKVLTWLIDTDGDWVLTMVRVVLGVVLFAHGAPKLLGWFGGLGLSATLRTFRDQLRIPAALACLIIAAEFFGGLGLIVGLLTRVAALAIIVIMAVAILMVHSKFGFFMNWSGNQRGEGFEYHLVVIALAVVVMVEGAGAFSFDSALSHHDVTVAKSIESAFGIGSEK